MQCLTNRIAVVTGAGRGLGRAIAIALAEQGARIALVGRNREMLEAVPVQGEVFLADVTSEADVLRLEAEVAARMGKAQILINNAGVALRKNITDITLADWHAVMDGNLTSAFLMTKAFIPHMREQKTGRIINIASALAHVSMPQRAGYSSSKSGMLGLTRAVALELATEGITVNTVSPGLFETDMTEGLRNNPASAADFMAKIPSGRFGKPEEVGALTAFLCSDAAAYITGTDVIIDGGWSAA